MTINVTSQLLLAALCASLAAGQTTNPAPPASSEKAASAPANLYGDDRIRLIVRADDFGFSHASNMALEKLCNEGIITAASVIVNTGWLDETVAILKNHPQVELHTYPGRDHAFARVGGEHYDAADAARAESRTLAFFERTLR